MQAKCLCVRISCNLLLLLSVFVKTSARFVLLTVTSFFYVGCLLVSINNFLINIYGNCSLNKLGSLCLVIIAIFAGTSAKLGPYTFVDAEVFTQIS